MKTITLNHSYGAVTLVMNTQKEPEKQREYEAKIVEKFEGLKNVEVILLKKKKSSKYLKHENVLEVTLHSELFEIIGEDILTKAIVVYVEEVDEKDLVNKNEIGFQKISNNLSIIKDDEVINSNFIVV